MDFSASFPSYTRIKLVSWGYLINLTIPPFRYHTVNNFQKQDKGQKMRHAGKGCTRVFFSVGIIMISPYLYRKVGILVQRGGPIGAGYPERE